MLARPPPSVNAPTFPPTMPQQSQLPSQVLPNQHRSPVLPPNFQGNQYSQMPNQPPLLPPNLSGNQLYPPHSSSSRPSSHSPTSSVNQEQYHSQSSSMVTNGTGMMQEIISLI